MIYVFVEVPSLPRDVTLLIRRVGGQVKEERQMYIVVFSEEFSGNTSVTFNCSDRRLIL